MPAVKRQDLHLTKEGRKLHEQIHTQTLEARLRILQSMDLFQSLKASELGNLADRLISTPFAEGDLIAKQGQVDRWLYVIAQGQVEIDIAEQTEEQAPVLTLGPGDFFGEMGVLTGRPRVATARAKTPVKSYRLDREAFTEILSARPEIVEEISDVMADRHETLEHAIHERSKRSHQLSDSNQTTIAASIRQFFRL